MIVNFHRNQIFMDFSRFLIRKVFMCMIFKVYLQHLFLDIRISTCSNSKYLVVLWDSKTFTITIVALNISQ